MKVLIYKRTHKYDPDIEGIFGCQDCMGNIRNRNFDAVIGIGGVSAWKGHDLKYKINWIGLNPKKVSSSLKKGDLVVFKHFALYEEIGENIKDNYPNLFKYMYEGGGNLIRHKMFNMSSDLPTIDVLDEIKIILDSIIDFPASKAYDSVENNDNVGTEKNCSSSKGCGSFERKNNCGV